MSRTVKLSVPIEDLPFEAGKGFFATVQNGVAHVFITTTEQPPKPEKTYQSLTWAENAQRLSNKIDLQTFHDNAKKDERLATLLEKYAPELLD